MADVPNLLLQNSGMITAYLFWHGENGGMTSYAKSFVVQKRSKPESYVYEQTECVNYSSWAERIEHLERSGISDDIIVDRIAQYMSENPILPETIGALPADRLPSAVEEALAQAKDSGLFNGKDGASGPQGEKGEKGDTPIRGMDYWTTSDIAQIKSYVDEAILGGMW